MDKCTSWSSGFHNMYTCVWVQIAIACIYAVLVKRTCVIPTTLDYTYFNTLESLEQGIRSTKWREEFPLLANPLASIVQRLRMKCTKASLTSPWQRCRFCNVLHSRVSIRMWWYNWDFALYLYYTDMLCHIHLFYRKIIKFLNWESAQKQSFNPYQSFTIWHPMIPTRTIFPLYSKSDLHHSKWKTF